MFVVSCCYFFIDLKVIHTNTPKNSVFKGGALEDVLVFLKNRIAAKELSHREGFSMYNVLNAVNRLL